VPVQEAESEEDGGPPHLGVEMHGPLAAAAAADGRAPPGADAG
jgi:hypothetical protein